ncbi:type VII secretion-associated serine protease mycosin [Winogradskya consettensis]|uniref:Type VII secretion-associated serine protease n=1 Tax=Winogradskya consettensis TaxID=113560 RepID=A0A919W5Z5_9ACTN|nr:type VII secretion-associated serine protease mycosin [Actinoplanes consettensis]GIM81680.1 type VII secretion-associated serine protease [Actinoplanes consettensis]
MRLVTRAARITFATAAVASLLGWTSAPAAADSIRKRQWHIADLDLSKAHHISRGDGVIVAVIDSGVDADHRDLAGAVLPGEDLVNDGQDGRSDLDGHGTQMAGIIAAHGHGDSSGILGIAPEAKILPVRLSINTFGTSGESVKAVAFAQKNDARVINMSFGGADDAPVQAAIRAALAADIVVVASSGNRGEAGDDFPGRYPEVLTVGATDQAGKIASFSVTGPQVDLTAPGVDIVTTGINSSGYYQGSGTSEATAVVSGAAALVRARFPELSAAEVVHRLTATAVDAGAPGRDDSYGYGRLDIVAALTADIPAAPATAHSESNPPSTAEALPQPIPKRTSPLLLTGIAAAVVLILGGLIVTLMLRRRR